MEPKEPELRLTQDGWEIHGGEYVHIPISVGTAIAVLPEQKEVILLKTRQLCGELRILAKARRTPRSTAARLLAVRDHLRQQLETAAKERENSAVRSVSQEPFKKNSGGLSDG